MFVKPLITLIITLLPITAQQNSTLPLPANTTLSSITYIPPSLLHSLPSAFLSPIHPASSPSLFSTLTPTNATITALFEQAVKSAFVVYDKEGFEEIFGEKPVLELICEGKGPEEDWAWEGGVWVPHREEVWFTPLPLSTRPNSLIVLHLLTSTLHFPTLTNTSHPLINPMGGTYWNGSIYFTTLGNNGTERGSEPSVLKVTPVREGDDLQVEVEVVINSWMGRRLQGPDDLVGLTAPNGQDYLYITDVSLTRSYSSLLPLSPSQGFNSLYRYNLHTNTLLPTLARSQILLPDGIAVSPDMKYVYVSDMSGTAGSDTEGVLGGRESTGSPGIWRYRVGEEGELVEGVLFGMARENFADGMRVDDSGNLWTAESDLLIRSPSGSLIASISASVLLPPKAFPLANFALAGDQLIILAHTRIWRVRLGKKVFSEERYESRAGNGL